MHSFISSFKSNFILKSLLIFLSLSVGYSVLIALFKPQINYFQNDVQAKKVVVAQRYIYEYYDKPVVIVGSSLSDRLNKDLLPENFYNLSFTAKSAKEGLEIIQKINAQPELILVEMNDPILNPADTKFINELFYPVFWQLKQYIPALREEYQPINLFVNFMMENFKRNNDENDKAEKSLVDQLIEKQLQERYSKPANPSELKNKLTDLKNTIDNLKQQGIKIAFYEMPCDKRISNSTLSASLKEDTHKIFPESKYLWLQNPTNTTYNTTDGLHLDYQSNLKYTKYFVKEVRNLIINDKELTPEEKERLFKGITP